MKNTTRYIRTGAALLMLGTNLVGANAPCAAQAKSAMQAKTTTTTMMAARQLSGSFKQVTHATRGKATVKGRTLTLSNFETGQGPKLRVYLARGATNSNDAVKAAVSSKKFVDLGALKNIKGTQSYAIPAKTQIKGSSVVVWCDKFDVAFGAAALS